MATNQSTPAQGISLLSLQEQIAAIAGALAGLQQPQAVQETPVTKVTAAPKASQRKPQAVANVAPVNSAVPTVSGSVKQRSYADPRENVVIIGRLDDGTQVTMGKGSKATDTAGYGYGFRIGDGRIKWAKSTTWHVQCALAAGIMAYVEAHPDGK